MLVTAATGPWWLAVICGLLYIVWFRGAEIVLVGLLADGVYGTGSVLPWYTTIFTLTLLLAEWLRPHVFIYNK